MASHRPVILSIAIAASAIGTAYWLHSNAAQGQGTLAQSPLNTVATVKPAFIMAIDDSGSMGFERNLIGGGADGRMIWNATNNSFFKDDGTFHDVSKGCSGVSPTPNDCYVFAFPIPGNSFRASASYLVMPPLDSLGFYRAPSINLAYFNPNTTYLPWMKADGTRHPNANPKSTLFDRRPNTATKTAYDLTADAYIHPDEYYDFIQGMTLPKGIDYFASTSCSGRKGTTSASLVTGRVTKLDADFVIGNQGRIAGSNQCQIAIPIFRATFFLQPDASNPAIPAAGQLPADYGYRADKIVKVDNAAGPKRSLLKYEIKLSNFNSPAQYNAAIQNFSNWYQYRRTRALAVAGALTDAFADVDQLRVGYTQFKNIQPTAVDTTMRDTKIGSADRAALYGAFEELWPSGSFTINRYAVQYLGEQFARTNAGAPITNACQRNIGLLFTDGYTTPRNGPTAIGNNDGGLGAPFSDGYSNTMADIATLYYEGKKVPLRGGPDFPAGLVPVADQCKTSTGDKRALDCKTDLHMNFYGISLGAKGIVYDVNAQATNNPYATTFSWGSDPYPIDDGTVIDEMWHATLNGRGKFINAKNPAAISLALRNVLADVGGGSSPSGAIGSSGVRLGSNSLSIQPRYTSTNNGTDWYGNLAAYAVSYDPITSQFSSQIKWNAEALLDGKANARAIHFGNATNTIHPDVKEFKASSFTGDAQSTFNILCADTLGNSSCKGQWLELNNPTTAQMINYLRGDKSLEGDTDGTTLNFRKRTTLLGDIVNSDVLVASNGDDYGYRYLVTNGKADELDYAGYLKSKYASQKTMVYSGANDGMLHAFDGGSGSELFAYIPTTAIGHMANLLFPYNKTRGGQIFQHRYFVDGPVVASDVHDGSWKTVVLATGGAGGKGVFALDVTSQSSSPTVMWELNEKVTATDSTGVAVGTRMGNVLGRPVIVPVATASGPKWKAIIGNGYDSVSGKAALLVVDIGSGDVTSIPAVESSVTATNGLGNLVAIDRWTGATKGAGEMLGRDGMADTVYAADQHGSVWKFDLRDNSVALGGKPLFTALDKNNARQPILGGIEVSAAGAGVMVFFGTGSFSFIDDPADKSMQTMYGILDQDTTAVSGRSQLQQQFITTSSNGVRTGTGSVGSIGKRGWYVDLGIDSGKNGNAIAAGERFIGFPLLQNGLLFFATYTPNRSVASSSCAVGGLNILYALNSLSGAAQMEDTRVDSATGAKPAAGTSGIELSGAGSGAIKEIASFLTAKSDPDAVADANKDSAPTSQCSVILQAAGAPALYMPRPCGRQSWRQIR